VGSGSVQQCDSFFGPSSARKPNLPKSTRASKLRKQLHVLGACPCGIARIVVVIYSIDSAAISFHLLRCQLLALCCVRFFDVPVLYTCVRSSVLTCTVLLYVLAWQRGSASVCRRLAQVPGPRERLRRHRPPIQGLRSIADNVEHIAKSIVEHVLREQFVSHRWRFCRCVFSWISLVWSEACEKNDFSLNDSVLLQLSFCGQWSACTVHNSNVSKQGLEMDVKHNKVERA
jgi:hypothetical protein